MKATSLTTGIKTRSNNTEDPYGYIVEWLEWDSGFRNSTLQYADIIIGVNEKIYVKENQEKDQPKAIGSYLESSFWNEHDAMDGQEIVLHVLRENKQLSIKGKILQQQIYLNEEGRQCFGVNGPPRMSNDGFASVWANWYEKFVHHSGLYIDDKRWERSAIDNRRILEEHVEWKDRIDYLVQHYPGDFSTAVLTDWELVRNILEGVLYTDIRAEDLEYRQLGEQRKLLVREAAVKDKAAFLMQTQDKTVPAFPAMDAVHGNIKDVTGKIVSLPKIGFNQFINDLGKSYAVVGSVKDGYYFIHLNSKEMDVFFKTLFHYQAQVTPDVPEQYQFIAELLNEPAILTYEGSAVTGIMVKLLAGTAGEEQVFIDVSKANGAGRAFFAGEAALSVFAGYQLDDDADPQQVIEAMICYIKLGDMASWKKLFCNWRIYEYGDGPPFMDLAYLFSEEAYQQAWTQSRHQILNAVYDARVLYTGPVKTTIEANKSNGVPRVDQVKIIVDHIGMFDGAYSSMSNLYLHRKWVLQRLNSGPWKIINLQPL
jgi:hypothetical protein